MDHVKNKENVENLESMANIFEDKTIKKALANMSPSPVRDSNPGEDQGCKVMKQVIAKAFSHLPELQKANFNSFGQKALTTNFPLTVTTLCSGTDGAVDAMKDRLLNS